MHPLLLQQLTDAFVINSTTTTSTVNRHHHHHHADRLYPCFCQVFHLLNEAVKLPCRHSAVHFEIFQLTSPCLDEGRVFRRVTSTCTEGGPGRANPRRFAGTLGADLCPLISKGCASSLMNPGRAACLGAQLIHTSPEDETLERPCHFPCKSTCALKSEVRVWCARARVL